jgi:hypothetical protein
VSVPNQPIGLTNFSGAISKCPPNPNAIRSIVFTKCDNLSVVNGAATEIQISLTNFFIPVQGASRLSFTIPGAVPTTPYVIHKLDLGGVDNSTGMVKFIGLLPQYGATCTNCPGATQGNSMNIEWTSISSIDEGELYMKPVVGPTGSTDFAYSQINKLQFGWGKYMSYDNSGTGALYAATYGGMLKWDGETMKLWNTLNSNLSTDHINSFDVDPYNVFWLATDNGLLKFKDVEGSTEPPFNVYSKPVPSNCLDIKIYNSTGAALATDSGLTILDTTGATCVTHNIYNTPLLKHNLIKKVDVSTDLIAFAGTTGGVYYYDTVSKQWGKFPLNSTTVTGWTAPNDVQSIASYDGLLYVGTTGGLVTIPYAGITGATAYPIAGMTASVTLSGATGPYNDNFSALRAVNYAGLPELYAGHGTGGAVSKLDITSDTWDFKVSTPFLTGGPVNDVLPDYLSGSTTARTVYTGNTLITDPYSSSGIVKLLTSPGLADTVPGAGDLTNLLFSSPQGSLSGNYTLDTTQLYSSNYVQPYGPDGNIWFFFSKGVDSNRLENYVSLKEGLTGAGPEVLLTATNWDDDGKIQIFCPIGSTVTSAPILLDKAAGYNLTMAMGITADDGSIVAEGLNVGFYTENIDPILGWNPLGKMLVLSGSDKNYIESIYLRNPETSDINVIALIGK